MHPDQWHESCWPAVEKEQRQDFFVPGHLTQNYFLWIHENGSEQGKNWLYNYKMQKWEVLQFETEGIQWGSKEHDEIIKKCKIYSKDYKPSNNDDRERETKSTNFASEFPN